MDLAILFEKITRHGLENVFKRYYSVYAAQVTNVDDPSKLKRIKVKIPDLLDDMELSAWCLPKAVIAGKSSGSFFPPKVGDWVYVEFKMGHLNHPMYSGGWWGKGEVPEYLSDENKNAIFISRYGHQITMDEKDGQQNILLQMKQGSKLEINEGAQFINLQDAKGNQLKFDYKNGALVLKFDGTMTEEINKAVTQTFNDNFTLKVAKDGSIEMGGKTVIKAGATASFFGATLTHLGAMEGAKKAVLGEPLIQFLSKIVQTFNSHIHQAPQAPSGVIPTSPPAPVLAAPQESAILSQKVKLS